MLVTIGAYRGFKDARVTNGRTLVMPFANSKILRISSMQILKSCNHLVDVYKINGIRGKQSSVAFI